MFKNTLVASVAVAFVAATALAASVQSGFQVGERVVPFHPTFVTGELAGKKACFPCTHKAAPQAQLWVRCGDLAKFENIVRTLDTAQGENNGFHALVVVLVPSAEHEKWGANLQHMAKEKEISNITIALLDPENKYVRANKFHEKAESTLILYKGWTVTNNWVNLQDDKPTITAIQAGVKQLMAR